jgi:hypothetical protein
MRGLWRPTHCLQLELRRGKGDVRGLSGMIQSSAMRRMQSNRPSTYRLRDPCAGQIKVTSAITASSSN